MLKWIGEVVFMIGPVLFCFLLFENIITTFLSSLSFLQALPYNFPQTHSLLFHCYCVYILIFLWELLRAAVFLLRKGIALWCWVCTWPPGGQGCSVRGFYPRGVAVCDLPHQFGFFLYIKKNITTSHLLVCVHTCDMAYLKMSGNNWEWVLSLHHVGLRGWTQAARTWGCRYLYLLSLLLASPFLPFNQPYCC